MDNRPEPGVIKWSPDPAFDGFIHVNLAHRFIQLYKPVGQARNKRFDFLKVSRHEETPPLTAYDWSPQYHGLVALGTTNNNINLVRIDDNSNSYYEKKLKPPRPCQAVSFNTGNLLAVGLDRVRNDQSLQIYDVHRISTLGDAPQGASKDHGSLMESFRRLEPSTSVTSVKFFEDNPQTLVAGIKGQCVRLFDLRDPSGAVTSFPTRCNNNLAIDYADQNFFASSALDHPAVMMWDRRATSRSVASPAYLEAMDNEELPWGCSLKVEQGTNTDMELLKNDKSSVIRSLRFNRDHRGHLAVLSRSGQLKVIETRKDFVRAEAERHESPECLETRMSTELDMAYINMDRKDDRIVSFDWVTLNSPVLNPRAVVLRASGAFEIVEKPNYTSEHVYKMVPWQTPYRGLIEGSSYHSLMQFEDSQYSAMMSSMLIDNALSEMPLFGDDKQPIGPIIEEALQTIPPSEDLIEDTTAVNAEFPTLFTDAAYLKEKMRGLRYFAKKNLKDSQVAKSDRRPLTIEELDRSLLELSLNNSGPPSNREVHEGLLGLTNAIKGFPKEAQLVLDHIMLLRANERYLFDFAANRSIVSDDPWLRDLWDWMFGAEQAAVDGGMVASGVDLSYMGVGSLWANDLGLKGTARLSEGTSIPDEMGWERCLQVINKRAPQPKYTGVATKKPAHRQAGMAICRWGRTQDMDFSDYARSPASERNSSWYTMAAAHALFEGDPTRAVQILKKASTEYPELLFVSLALQLIGRGDTGLAQEQLDFDDAVASKTDPYLRAISSIIATNDWEVIGNQESLPLRDRTYVALRYFDDEKLGTWLQQQIVKSIETGDIEGIVLTGVTDDLVDIFAKYIEKFNDVQTATLVLSVCAPRYIDDYRCLAWRNAYRAYLQRHKAFFQRTKFEVESTKRSKLHGVPTVKPRSRQIALRCVYCDAAYELSKTQPAPPTEQRNPLMASNINAGISCPNCGRHLPRCVVCLEVVGVPRSDKPEPSSDPGTRAAARFPTFCLKCDHVLHLDHARQWFSKHSECPVPECRCRCNFRANVELNYH